LDLKGQDAGSLLEWGHTPRTFVHYPSPQVLPPSPPLLGLSNHNHPLRPKSIQPTLGFPRIYFTPTHLPREGAQLSLFWPLQDVQPAHSRSISMGRKNALLGPSQLSKGMDTLCPSLSRLGLPGPGTLATREEPTDHAKRGGRCGRRDRWRPSPPGSPRATRTHVRGWKPGLRLPASAKRASRSVNASPSAKSSRESGLKKKKKKVEKVRTSESGPPRRTSAKGAREESRAPRRGRNLATGATRGLGLARSGGRKSRCVA
jgi:hypothetical protein